jgi:hypothetical protein
MDKSKQISTGIYGIRGGIGSIFVQRIYCLIKMGLERFEGYLKIKDNARSI